jgi:hypothetical protein
MSQGQTLAGAYQSYVASITAGNTTLGKILVPRTPAGALISAAPDLTLMGGCRLIGGQITSSDTSARSIQAYVGHRTLVNGSSVLTVGSTSTIVRSTGSFLNTAATLADNNGPGWQVGDLAMLFYTAQGANNGLLITVTGVSATTLTVNGTALTVDASPGVTAELYRVALRTTLLVPIGAGNTNNVPPAQLMGSSQDVDLAAQPDRGIQFGPDEVLIVASTATISAVPVNIGFTAHCALY